MPRNKFAAILMATLIAGAGVLAMPVGPQMQWNIILSQRSKLHTNAVPLPLYYGTNASPAMVMSAGDGTATNLMTTNLKSPNSEAMVNQGSTRIEDVPFSMARTAAETTARRPFFPFASPPAFPKVQNTLMACYRPD
jgi:hypothetical protein